MPLAATLDVTTNRAVSFSFRVVNDGTSAIDLTFRSGKRADVVVRDATTQEEVWRWSDGRLFTQALQRATLRPGEQIEQSFEWDDPESGSYVVVGTLEADQEARAETELSI